MGISPVTNILRSRSSAEQKARAALRDATGERRMAELARSAKIESVQRLEAIVTAGAAAERAVAQAQAAAHTGAVAWADAGAADSETEHEKLLALVAERRRAADVASIRAHGARQALPAAQEAAEQAGHACDRARQAVLSAKGPVLVAMLAAQFAKLEQADRMRSEARTEIAAASNVFCVSRVAGEPWHRLAEGVQAITDALRAAGGAPLYKPEHDSNDWAELAKRLDVDADADFVDG